MTKIDEMLKELCPNGVEWKELWEITIWDKKFNSVARHKQTEIDKYDYLLAKELSQMVELEGNVKILTTSPSELFTSEQTAQWKYYDKEIIAIPWGGNPVIHYYKGKFLPWFRYKTSGYVKSLRLPNPPSPFRNSARNRANT